MTLLPDRENQLSALEYIKLKARERKEKNAKVLRKRVGLGTLTFATLIAGALGWNIHATGTKLDHESALGESIKPEQKNYKELCAIPVPGSRYFGKFTAEERTAKLSEIAQQTGQKITSVECIQRSAPWSCETVAMDNSDSFRMENTDTYVNLTCDTDRTPPDDAARVVKSDLKQ